MTATPDTAAPAGGVGGAPRVVSLPRRTPRRWSAAAGVVAAAVALGTAELLAGVIPDVPSLVLAIGNGVVELGSGSSVKEIAIALFGTHEKTALVVGTVVLALAFGALLGVLADRRSLWWGTGGFVAFAGLGVLATTVNPLDDTALALLPAVVAAVAGVMTLRFMLGRAGRIATGPPAEVTGPDGRRQFLQLGAGLTVAAGIAGAFGRSLLTRTQAVAARGAVVLPGVTRTVPPTPDAVAFDDIPGLSPLFTPNEDFYRIDTALTTPMVDAETWSMRIHGMVDREVTLTYADLLDMPQVEADITIACVSNEVGGGLIGTARWQGVRLADVLDLAGVAPDAGQLVGRSVDGWTAGFPTELAFDGRDALVAVAMNDEPLPLEHGFPARLIVPGLYGYVSATKWLAEIELTTWDAFDGYWVPRGWSKEGPIKTQSRIDVPRRSEQLAAGPQVIAGVAWAPHRGISRVEVSIDDGEWLEAELTDELTIDVWRQWRVTWDAAPGDHTIRVRATDATGMTQSAERVPVAPDGAEGYHTRATRVV